MFKKLVLSKLSSFYRDYKHFGNNVTEFKKQFAVLLDISNYKFRLPLFYFV